MCIVESTKCEKKRKKRRKVDLFWVPRYLEKSPATFTGADCAEDRVVCHWCLAPIILGTGRRPHNHLPLQLSLSSRCCRRCRNRFTISCDSALSSSVTSPPLPSSTFVNFTSTPIPFPSCFPCGFGSWIILVLVFVTLSLLFFFIKKTAASVCFQFRNWKKFSYFFLLFFWL